MIRFAANPLSMKQFSELSLDELQKRKSTLKSVLIGFIVLAVIIVLLFAYLYFFMGKRVKIVSLIPLFILPITWLPIFISLKSINDEIILRQSKNP